MSRYKRYCRNILKQYGKNIKAYEERLDNPLDMKIKKLSGLNSQGDECHFERRTEVSFFVKKGSKRLDSYESIVENAK